MKRSKPLNKNTLVDRLSWRVALGKAGVSAVPSAARNSIRVLEKHLLHHIEHEVEKVCVDTNLFIENGLLHKEIRHHAGHFLLKF